MLWSFRQREGAVNIASGSMVVNLGLVHWATVSHCRNGRLHFACSADVDTSQFDDTTLVVLEVLSRDRQVACRRRVDSELRRHCSFLLRSGKEQEVKRVETTKRSRQLEPGTWTRAASCGDPASRSMERIEAPQIAISTVLPAALTTDASFAFELRRHRHG